MTDLRLDLVALVCAYVGWAGSLAALAVLLKRSAVARWRRWQVHLLDERCAVETAPIFCNRSWRD